MTKLTIEVPDEAARIAAEKSQNAHMTLSEWIALCILGRLGARSNGERDKLGYPMGWFDKTYGSLSDVDDLIEPADQPPKPAPALNL